MWRDELVHLTWTIHMCDIPHTGVIWLSPSVWCDSFTRVACIIQMHSKMPSNWCADCGTRDCFMVNKARDCFMVNKAWSIKHETSTHQPWNLNPKSSTLNHKPLTPKPSTLNRKTLGLIHAIHMSGWCYTYEWFVTHTNESWPTWIRHATLKKAPKDPTSIQPLRTRTAAQ